MGPISRKQKRGFVLLYKFNGLRHRIWRDDTNRIRWRARPEALD